MKTNYYILLILLLSFSFVKAQDKVQDVEIESNTVVSVFESNDEVATNDTLKVVTEKEDELINASELKESLARSSSDIRIYLNRVRVKKVDNIKLVFPKINKAVKA